MGQKFSFKQLKKAIYFFTKMVSFHSQILKEKFELVPFGNLICHVVPPKSGSKLKLCLRTTSIRKICKQMTWRPKCSHI